jgi:hypothetical protein
MCCGWSRTARDTAAVQWRSQSGSKRVKAVAGCSRGRKLRKIENRVKASQSPSGRQQVKLAGVKALIINVRFSGNPPVIRLNPGKSDLSFKKNKGRQRDANVTPA